MSDFNSSLAPHKLEPGSIGFAELHAELYPDCRRVHVTVATEGEGHRPSIDFQIKDPSGMVLSRSVVVENYDARTDITMHLKNVDYEKPLTLYCRAYFDQSDFSAEKSVPITES
jgi:hypothetical protein